MRPRVKFVTAVWGEAYVRHFTELALPSYLAPGNLPALAAATELEAVILTLQRDIETFQSYVAFRRLRDICAVRFVAIDDLVTGGVYGVTLTLAYARAVIGCGADMLRTHFVLMNADFVLADGSLRRLLRHILAGRSIVLGPSFRAVAEDLEPQLRKAVDRATGTLAMPPREMVALALRHPHATTIAKTMHQELCHVPNPNQFFWWVNEDTVLGRYFLIFPLCLKPERAVTSINSYCDYGFIPELCPSGDEVVMGDSDDFFMLELQGRDQEKFLLRTGWQSERDIARSLSEWTTAEHRRAAQYDIIFHAQDLTPEIEAAKSNAQSFIARIMPMLGRLLAHAFHGYWVAGVWHFKWCRRAEGLSASPPELDWALFARGRSIAAYARFYWRSIKTLTKEFVRHTLRAVLKTALGCEPHVTLLHPAWFDYQLLRKSLTGGALPQDSILVVRDRPRIVDPLLEPTRVRLATPKEILRGVAIPAERVERVVICVHPSSFQTLLALVRRCRSLAIPGADCHIVILGLDIRGGQHLPREILELIREIWTQRPHIHTVGGTVKALCNRLIERLEVEPLRWRLIRTVPLLVALPQMFLWNLASQLNPARSNCRRHISSVFIKLRLPEETIQGSDRSRTKTEVAPFV